MNSSLSKQPFEMHGTKRQTKGVYTTFFTHILELLTCKQGPQRLVGNKNPQLKNRRGGAPQNPIAPFAIDQFVTLAPPPNKEGDKLPGGATK